jgi:hypothetical protein
MAVSLFQDVPLKSKIIGWGIIVAPLASLFLLGAIFLRPDPIDQRLVWGCYVADGAPALAVQGNLIRVLDGKRRSLNYVAEPYKEGYRLMVQPALYLVPSAGGGYTFTQGRGIGYFWPLLARGSDEPRKVRSPQDYGGRLSLIASDGTQVIYVRLGNRKVCN